MVKLIQSFKESHMLGKSTQNADPKELNRVTLKFPKLRDALTLLIFNVFYSALPSTLGVRG